MFCGNYGIKVGQLVGIKETSDVYSIFKNRNVFYVHKGRTAIRLACRLLGLGSGDEILAPSYNCGSEIDALLDCGAFVTLYQVNKSTAVDLVDLERKITSMTKAVYVTHYFGFAQHINEIKKICLRRKLYLIEDCALSLFSRQGDQLLGMIGDFSIFSFPKTLPVPDGGILLINNTKIQKSAIKLSPPNSIKIILETLPVMKSGFLKSLSTRKYLYRLSNKILYYNKTKNRLINFKSAQDKPDIPRNYYYDSELTEKRISYITKRMLRTFNVENIVQRRRENFITYLTLLSHLDDIEPIFKELPDGVCPLNFPIIVKNRDELRNKLRERNIEAGVWWKGYHKSIQWDEFKDATFLKDHCLTLPVHQDIDYQCVFYIVKNFIETRNCV
jgi:dTDP-4-amino-4,6-dideoxygalactose transaminase